MQAASEPVAIVLLASHPEALRPAKESSQTRGQLLGDRFISGEKSSSECLIVACSSDEHVHRNAALLEDALHRVAGSRNPVGVEGQFVHGIERASARARRQVGRVPRTCPGISTLLDGVPFGGFLPSS